MSDTRAAQIYRLCKKALNQSSLEESSFNAWQIVINLNLDVGGFYEYFSSIDKTIDKLEEEIDYLNIDDDLKKKLISLTKKIRSTYSPKQLPANWPKNISRISDSELEYLNFAHHFIKSGGYVWDVSDDLIEKINNEIQKIDLFLDNNDFDELGHYLKVHLHIIKNAINSYELIGIDGLWKYSFDFLREAQAKIQKSDEDMEKREKVSKKIGGFVKEIFDCLSTAERTVERMEKIEGVIKYIGS